MSNSVSPYPGGGGGYPLPHRSPLGRFAPLALAHCWKILATPSVKQIYVWARYHNNYYACYCEKTHTFSNSQSNTPGCIYHELLCLITCLYFWSLHQMYASISNALFTTCTLYVFFSYVALQLLFTLFRFVTNFGYSPFHVFFFVSYDYSSSYNNFHVMCIYSS